MRKLVQTCAVLLVALLLAGTALAHDAWVQPNVTVADPGERVYLDIMVGNHSNHHQSYRIAGKLDPNSVSLIVGGPGARADLTQTLVDYGESSETPPPGAKGYLGASFVPAQEGLYAAVMTYDAVLQHGGPRFRAFKKAKTYVYVPSAADGGVSSAPWREGLAPDGLELIPIDNPVSLRQGDEFRVQLALKGEPLAGEAVSMIRRRDRAVWTSATDENGIAAFPVAGFGYYLLRAEAIRPQDRAEGEYDETHYEATLVVVVR